MSNSSVFLINQRFSDLDTRIRDLDAARASDRRDVDVEIDTTQKQMAVITEQVATMVSAFRAARTAFYSLTTALVVACIIFLITGH